MCDFARSDGGSQQETKEREAARRQLMWAIGLSFAFMLVEVSGGEDTG